MKEGDSMKLADVYAAAVRKGMQVDPRGPVGVQRVLDATRKAYDALPESRRWEFDTETLTNPFVDCRILVGDPATEVGHILVGIDIGVGEVLLADRLRERGRPIDLILAHHPEGRPLVELEEVMGVQADMLHRVGVPLGIADALMDERKSEIRRGLHHTNAEQAVDAARLLGIPLMCCHTPADNSVQDFLQRWSDGFDEQATLGEMLEGLRAIPEFRQAVVRGAGPVLFNGEEDRRVGKILVEMTGGTSGPIEALEHVASAGVSTLLDMHIPEAQRTKAKDLRLNVIISGHMASDSLGMNLVIDELEREGVATVECSGFTRVSRV
jgi:putative NIF3 family GTP cyclohydrolase 1 type 2